MSDTSTPNLYGAIVAKQQLDEELCKVLTFLVPVHGQPQRYLGDPARQFIDARLAIARRHLDRFEAALKGGA